MRMRLAAAIFVLSITGYAEAAEFFGSVSAGTGYDDNVIRGLDSLTRAGDLMYRARLDGGVNLPVDDRSGVTVSTRWEATQLHRFDELSSLRGAASVRYLLRPGTDFTSPWYALEVEAAGLGHKESRIRDSWLVSIDASAGQRFTDRLSGSVAYRYELRQADVSDVFDTEMQTVTGSLEYQLTRDFNLYAGYQIGAGELNAVAVMPAGGGPGQLVFDPVTLTWVHLPGGPAIPRAIAKGGINSAARDTALQSVFGRDVFAYQTDGLFNRLTIGGHLMVTHSFSVDLSGYYYNADGEQRLDYHAFGTNLSAAYYF